MGNRILDIKEKNTGRTFTEACREGSELPDYKGQIDQRKNRTTMDVRSKYYRIVGIRY